MAPLSLPGESEFGVPPLTSFTTGHRYFATEPLCWAHGLQRERICGNFGEVGTNHLPSCSSLPIRAPYCYLRPKNNSNLNQLVGGVLGGKGVSSNLYALGRGRPTDRVSPRVGARLSVGGARNLYDAYTLSTHNRALDYIPIIWKDDDVDTQ